MRVFMSIMSFSELKLHGVGAFLHTVNSLFFRYYCTICDINHLKIIVQGHIRTMKPIRKSWQLVRTQKAV